MEKFTNLIRTMAGVTTLVFCALLGISLAADVSFPAGFKFGASTSAYQIEGAWNVSDKGKSIWDHYIHTDPTVISDLTNGDVACDSYNKWERDIEMAKELGLDYYRFSISWVRILPNGFSNIVSADGSQYYNNLIDGLLAVGIEPMVTMNHFDLPQVLQDLGGWVNPHTVEWYANYARVLFRLYGDRVKYWITFNEPSLMCDLSYNAGGTAPAIIEEKIAAFLCTKHILLAHATAWRIYDEEYKHKFNGKVSISHMNVGYFPQNATTDQELTNLVQDYMTSRYTHPVFSKEGGWPKSFVKAVSESSIKEGFEVSRLPELSEEEIEFIRGTYDFYALNYYSCREVRTALPDETVSTNFFLGIPELNAVMEIRPNTMFGASPFLPLCPEGLRQQLAWIKEQYGDIEIMITENGYSTYGSIFDDSLRIDFIRNHLEQVLMSIYLDEVNVTGYTYWSLMDNFEWTSGFEIRMGLYEVDYNSTDKTRTPRDSAYYYKSIIQNRSLTVDATYDEYFPKQ